MRQEEVGYHHESSFTEETWDKKKILLFALLTILGIFAYFSKIAFLDKKNVLNEVKLSLDRVKGATTKKDLSTEQKIEPKYTNSLKSGIQEKLDFIKSEVTGLQVQEVASSSPSVQKILNDIKNLENLPKNQAKETCKKICEGL